MVNFAIIGSSSISEKFIDALKSTKECNIYALLSREINRGKEFAKKFNIEKVYTNIEELLNDSKIDAVYIASPNGKHFEQAKLSLEAKKNVICEKPIVPTVKEFDILKELALKNKVTLMEAMRPTTNPNFKIIKDNLYKIGDVRQILVKYCQYSSRYDLLKNGEVTNIFNKELAGGSLYDIGVYPLYFTLAMFGEPKEYFGYNFLLSSGVDGCGSILLKYEDKIANISYSKITHEQSQSEILGENGSIIIDKVSHVKGITIKYRDGREEKLGIKLYENDMRYEIEEFIKLIKIGEVESKLNSFTTSRKCVEIMENIANK
ncbi:Gfo/Idh/MocA family oxidoreductase [uncultured Fusobacterium sp.]|uniref:Gfo/Idh/MocA family protein n=1 Tax=uncultured Fusobacterium sp. TaxID=159267 RepID=UPI0025D86258|nr:Gfo/Idh/MocA family oxidoreductase [uncultured Fusobacterium sp.]